MTGRQVQKKAFRVFIYVVVIVICIWVVAPFLWLMISSVSTRNQLTEVPLQWLPDQLNLENYKKALFGEDSAVHRSLRRGAVNSLVVAGGATLTCLVASSLGAYAFSRLQFPMKRTFLITLLVTQLLPTVALIIPIYIIMLALNLLNTVWALMLAVTAMILPLMTWILRGYFASVPRGLEDAARIDGCSRLGTVFRIMLPLSAPGLAASGLFAFVIAWNEFFTAFILSSTMASKTLSVVVSEFTTKVGTDYVAMSTAGVLTSLPPVILAILFQRYIVRGLTAGAVK